MAAAVTVNPPAAAAAAAVIAVIDSSTAPRIQPNSRATPTSFFAHSSLEKEAFC
jgi:hypothetical protein